MANLKLKIRFDFDRLYELEPSLQWAVESGLLTEEEAINTAADDLVANMTIEEEVQDAL